MNNERLSLLSNMTHIFNENQIGSADYELAKFFLKNYVSISKMNIYDVADQNHVSRATVRRFCDRLGYNNFKEMKAHFGDFNEGIEKYRHFYSGNDFRTKLVAQLNSMMAELNNRMNTPEKNSIIKSMLDADDVYIFASSRVATSVLAFQQELVNFGLTIHIADTQEDIQSFKPFLSTKSLIIVFSITGVFADSIWQTMVSVPGRKILFTLKRDVTFNRTFDKIYHFREQGNSKINDQLYYTYGMNFILDILFKDYLDYIYKKEER